MNAHVEQPRGWMQIVLSPTIFAFVIAIRAPRLMRVRPLDAVARAVGA